MTDEQIMQFVVKEHAAGTSNQQIVTQLMQRGVDIQQIRRVRNKYEREVKSKGLGNLSADTQPTDDRSRQRNGKTREDYTDQRQTLPSISHTGPHPTDWPDCL